MPAPDTLPADFFGAKPQAQSSTPETLPADFFGAKQSGQTKPNEGEKTTYGGVNLVRKGKDWVPQEKSAMQKAGDFASGVVDTVKGAAQFGLRAADAATNPFKAAQFGSDIVQGQVDQAKQAKQSFKQGNYSEAIGHGLASAVPLVGPAAAQAGENIGDPTGENTWRGVGQAAGMLAPAAASAVIPAAARAAEKTGVTSAIRNSAERQYERALAPKARLGDQKFKVMAQKAVAGKGPDAPGLLDRGVVAATRRGLQTKVTSLVDDLGAQLDDMHANLPPDMAIPTSKILDAIENAKQSEFMLNGKPTSPTAAAGARFMDKLKQTALDQSIDGASGPEINYQGVRKLRQEWDSYPAKQGGFAGNDLLNNTKLRGYKGGANALRGEMADATPDIAAKNQEFSVVKTGKDVIDDTVQRTRSAPTSLSRKAVKGASAVMGAQVAGLKGAALGYEAAGAADSLMGSTAWNTGIAVLKNKVVNMIRAGQTAQAHAYMLTLQPKEREAVERSLSGDAPPSPRSLEQ